LQAIQMTMKSLLTTTLGMSSLRAFEVAVLFEV
jgi:hypothetical protein